MGVFEIEDGKTCALLGWRPGHAYVCTKYATKKGSWIPSMGVFEMQNTKTMHCWRDALMTHTMRHQKWIWIPGMGVFEMHNAKKGAFLAWRPEHAYLWTKYPTQSVFGYLVWVCLKCTMPKNVHSWRGAPNMHTSGPHMPAKLFLDA